MHKKMSYKIGGTLAVVALALSPVMASAATQSGNTTINATIGSTISLSTNGTVAISVTPTGAGAASTASDTVTVSTNDADGYTLSIQGDDATPTLTNGANTIAAQVTPGDMANNSWGYSLDVTTVKTNVANLTGNWLGVPASGSPAQLKTTATTASADATTVWYGVKADTSKPSGVYTGTVTYTAVTNA